ncbi:MAG: CopG family transcriptional regulator [Clostridia bacterium]|nr:CopG family transcriptional regulator [Clostridia bacterium]
MNEIKITKKNREDDGHKVISVRMRTETINQLEDLSKSTNRSRNELINILLETALGKVKVEENN